MKKETYYSKAMLLLSALVLFSACETGMRNKQQTVQGMKQPEAPSGIVNKKDRLNANASSHYASSNKLSIKKVYSKSATPGYYVQIGYFKTYKPSATFMKRLNASGYPYTILQKNNSYHALIGAYKTYNIAQSKLRNVKAKLNRKAFIIEVKRP